MKVTILSSTNNVRNGYGNITHELCSLLKNHIDLTLLLPRDEVRYPGLIYRTEYVLPRYIFNLKTPKAFEYLTFFYPQAQNADIIHSLFEFPYALVAARLARKYKKPLIIGSQGTYAIRPLFMWPEKYFVKWAYNYAQVITAPSVFTKENILKFSKTKTSIEVIHNGVNFERFQQIQDVSQIKLRYPNKKLLLTVGGLKPRKGQDIVIRALGLLKNQRQDFHYLIIGSDAKYQIFLENLAKENGVFNFISFLGERQADELVKYFQACDIYVHTPRMINWNFEGFGIVYLEASACGKPIIAADSGGVKDAVIENHTGIIVKEDDPLATASAIIKLLNSPKLASYLGDNGREYAKKHDWSKIGEQFIELYKTIL